MAVATSSHANTKMEGGSESTFGQLIKRIRSRSKSPAPRQKLAATMTSVEIENNPPHSPRRGWTKSSTMPGPPPPRSPSGKRLKQWLLGTNTASQSATLGSSPKLATHKSPSGGFGSWVQAKLTKSPRQTSSEHPRRGKGARSAELRNQDKRGALSEEDLVSKSLASEIVSSSHQTPVDKPMNGCTITAGVAASMMSSYHSQDSVFDAPTKLPSYVRVSCALSGYSSYRPGYVPSSSPRVHSQGRSLVERRLDAIGNNSSSPNKPATPPKHMQLSKTPVKQIANTFESPTVITNGDLLNRQRTPLYKQDDGVSEQVHCAIDETDQVNVRPIIAPKPAIVACTETLSSPTEGVFDLAPMQEDISSSADTDTCITGPLTTTSFEGSFMEEVLRAADGLPSPTMQMDSIADPGVLEPVLELPETPSQSDESHVVGHKFERICAEERARLEELCSFAEEDLQNELPEDAADVVRIAVGKCRLLLRKKFSRFEELVSKNMNPLPCDDCPALDDDLEGYWHLVYMQVIDVDNCFKIAKQCKANDWIVEKEVEISPPSSKSPSPRRENNKPKEKDNSKQRDEARNRIKQAKLAAKQRMAASQCTDNNAEETLMFIA